MAPKIVEGFGIVGIVTNPAKLDSLGFQTLIRPPTMSLGWDLIRVLLERGLVTVKL